MEDNWAIIDPYLFLAVLHFICGDRAKETRLIKCMVNICEEQNGARVLLKSRAIRKLGKMSGSSDDKVGRA